MSLGETARSRGFHSVKVSWRLYAVFATISKLHFKVRCTGNALVSRNGTEFEIYDALQSAKERQLRNEEALMSYRSGNLSSGRYEHSELRSL